MAKIRIVPDTNVFVAAGFNPRSNSARIMRSVEAGWLELVWHAATRRETQRILKRIPPLSWLDFAPLFTKDAEYIGALAVEDFSVIDDPEDRKFAALAADSGSTLITSDDHLLGPRARLGCEVLTPAEFLALIDNLAPPA